ncbi:MAG: hypothetical protein A2176_00165 [Spirochaetes bacterium RBG_13_51_14]|nr:MAG: hypothetical protein A2176_00165 [Spirochaetes bacterium RBG_13_51_14]
MSSYCLACSKLGQDCCREAHAKFITLGDARRVADYLGADINSFAVYGELKDEDREEYIYINRHQNYYYDLTRRDGRLLQLKDKSDGSCMFQEEDGCCRIYPSRPLICRTYPFWYSDDFDILFDPCGSDCRIVCAVTGNDNPEDVTKLDDAGGSRRAQAMAYIGHTDESIKELLGTMKDEIADYEAHVELFVRNNNISIP